LKLLAENGGGSNRRAAANLSEVPVSEVLADGKIVAMKKLDKKAVWLFFIGALGTVVVLFAVLGFYTIIESQAVREIAKPAAILPWVLVAAGALIVVSYIWARLTYHFYRYDLTDQGFRKEYGIIWKKYVTIPYARIQNVDIYRGLLARLLGLSDLNIQTAGAGVPFGSAAGFGAEGRLPGLSRADAERVRDELLRRAGPKDGQGL
jgi:membrane protein YdbS with pleckstrin-like domain